MSRAHENTTLLPVSGLLLALLMIASLLGVQGAVDRALNFELSAGSGLTDLANRPLTGPPVIARQPVQRAANVAESNSSAVPGEPRTGSPPNITSVEPASSLLTSAESSTPAVPMTGEILTPDLTSRELMTSLFKPKKLKGSQRRSLELVSAKAAGVQLFESTSEPTDHRRPLKAQAHGPKGSR